MKKAAVAFLLAATSACSAAPPLDGPRIDQLTGAKGTWIEAEGVYKVTQPRAEVAVTVDGAKLPPFAGLTSWAAFKAGNDGRVMLMGDLVLFEDEVDAAMGAALDGGLAVTALHNHFLREEPRVFFMHIGGDGDVEALAAGVGKALAAVKAVRAAAPQPAPGAGKPLPEKSSIDGAALEGILGVAGTARDGMWKAVIGRTVTMPCDCEAGKEMGVNTWAAFVGSDADAAVDGDFATVAGELQPVLRALHKAGIRVVAIHSHMEGESPRIVFLHYWGRGAAADLARGVRSALDAQREKRFDFDADAPGALPGGWKAEKGNWKVGEKGRAGRCLALADTGGNSGFNLCWRADVGFQDGELEAQVRADAGEADQGGGVAWRVKDARNYYVARYNPLESNFRVYVVKDGTRKQLASAEGLGVKSGEWFRVRIEQRGDAIACFLNGKKLLEATDATFPEAGGVGLWSKADAASSFDDVVLTGVAGKGR
ncbi:MAG: DUF1259 domain-containing protein [Planctomycetes bacterium]|nr:DUF1259 domain-containing protein [Planctomycetota bacterium]